MMKCLKGCHLSIVFESLPMHAYEANLKTSKSHLSILNTQPTQLFVQVQMNEEALCKGY